VSGPPPPPNLLWPPKPLWAAAALAAPCRRSLRTGPPNGRLHAFQPSDDGSSRRLALATSPRLHG
jgi:hypothetical protein